MVHEVSHPTHIPAPRTVPITVSCVYLIRPREEFAWDARHSSYGDDFENTNDEF
jgi:hypothetical protein